MVETSCVLCQCELTPENQLNIQLTTTKIGQVNLEDFLKETILELEENANLHSNYLCQQCFAAVNTLEDHFLMYKSIQRTLLTKYNELNHNLQHDFNIKQEYECLNNVYGELDPLNATEEQKLEITPDIVINSNKTVKLQGRKSGRKRVPPPNYSEDIKKDIKKKSGRATKQNTKDKSNSEIMEDCDINLPEKPAYCCEICGKQYVNYNGWNIHRRKHKNENLIRCEYCDKTFTQKIGLRRHLHIHTGTYPYQCEICNKKFIHTSSFKIHKQIHAGKRDHTCEMCGMGFYTKPCLNRHIRSHRKEKRHGCPICGTMFTEKYNLTAHIAKVHGKERQAQDSIETSNELINQ